MRTMYFNLGIFLSAIFVVNALYDGNSDVVDLNPTNFDKRVVDSDDVWIIEFYAPWCGHCKALVPEYGKAAKALKGVIKVGAVNADQHQALASQFGIRGFPTIKVFASNKRKPEEYSGPRTADGFIDAAFKALRSKVDAQLGGRKTSGGSKPQGDSKDVIELTDSNFEATVLQSDDMWLVEFYAPWCGHCKNLAPHWASAATELKGKVKVGVLDATVHTVTSGKYNVRGFPTIKFFSSGKKSADSAEDYDGGRTSGDIVTWAMDKLAQNIPPPEVLQITDADILKNSCEGHQLCIIAILPHILDCQSKCRNEYIGTLKKLGEKYKKNLWGWVWAEATAQLDLEEGMGIGGFGYPALAAANVRKMKYSLLRGSFSYDGINEFLRELAVGRGSTIPLKGATLPKIVKTEAWDGKDGKLDIVEEEIDLDDVDLKKEEL